MIRNEHHIFYKVGDDSYYVPGSIFLSEIDWVKVTQSIVPSAILIERGWIPAATYLKWVLGKSVDSVHLSQSLESS